MNILDLKRFVFHARQGDAGGNTGGVGSGTNSGMSGSSGNSGGGGSTSLGTGRSDTLGLGDLGSSVTGGTFGISSSSAPSTTFGGGTSAGNAQRANEIAAQLSVDPMDALMAATGAFGTAASNPSGSISEDGFTYGELSMLDSLGYGNIAGVNPNNPTQSIAEAMASYNTHSWLDKNIPTLFGMVSPVAAMSVSALQQALGLLSGKTSIGRAAVNAATQAVASKLGIPVGVVTGVINKDPGQVASAALAGTINSALASELASITGIPANMVSLGFNIAGVPGMVSSGISGTVNSALGTTPSGQTNTSSLAGSINSALGIGPGVGATAAPASTSSFGSFGSGSGGAGGFSLSGSSGAASPFTVQPAVSSAISSGSAGTTSSGSAIPTSNAAIKSMQDLWGPGIDPNFLTSNANQFSDGGSIEDLLQILRS